MFLTLESGMSASTFELPPSLSLHPSTSAPVIAASSPPNFHEVQQRRGRRRRNKLLTRTSTQGRHRVFPFLDPSWVILKVTFPGGSKIGEASSFKDSALSRTPFGRGTPTACANSIFNSSPIMKYRGVYCWKKTQLCRNTTDAEPPPMKYAVRSAAYWIFWGIFDWVFFSPSLHFVCPSPR